MQSAVNCHKRRDRPTMDESAFRIADNFLAAGKAQREPFGISVLDAHAKNLTMA